MLLEELMPLDEGMLKTIFAAALLTIGSLGANPSMQEPTHAPVSAPQRHGVDTKALMAHMAQIAGDKYDVDPTLIAQVVQAAVKHQYQDFPRAKDILAVVGVESSFRPTVKSALKKDPAQGLMQVRPKAMGLKVTDLATIEQQIEHGAEILHRYFKQLGSREAAIQAYNVGPKNYRLSATHPKKGNPRYLPKVDAEKDIYKDVDL